MKKRHQKSKESLHQGFTLIELLVVIAIIGILAAVVLVNIWGSTSKARAASILSNLDSAKTQAAIYHISNGSYAGLCNHAKIQEIVASLKDTGESAKCFVADTTYSYINAGEASELSLNDWGIAVYADERYYVGSRSGPGTVEEDTTQVNANDWDTARSLCASEGKRLPTPSELLAMYYLPDNDADAAFADNRFWSSLESPSQPGRAYFVYLNSGVVHAGAKSSTSLGALCVD